MEPIEIIVLIVSIAIVVLVFGRMIYKRAKGMSPSECSCCKSNMKRTIKKISKELEEEKKCECNCNI